MCDGQLAVGRARLPGPVTLDDLVNVDVAPTPGAPIDDLEYRLLAKKFADGERVPAEPLRASWFAVRSGCRANRLAVDHQRQGQNTPQEKSHRGFLNGGFNREHRSGRLPTAPAIAALDPRPRCLRILESIRCHFAEAALGSLQSFITT